MGNIERMLALRLQIQSAIEEYNLLVKSYNGKPLGYSELDDGVSANTFASSNEITESNDYWESSDC